MGRLNSEQKGGRLDMGKTTSKKMIPLLILRILWKHADKEHMVTMDFICNRLEEDFEAERRMKIGITKTGFIKYSPAELVFSRNTMETGWTKGTANM